MAAPSYTNDLTDLSTAESVTNWVEMTGSVTLSGGSEAFNTQGAPAGGDPDYPFIQGLYSVTQDCTKDVSVGSLAYNNGSGTGGHGTDGAYLVWQNYMINNNLETYANDGFMLLVGSGLGDFDVWTVGGRDKAPYPYGGWVNHAVNTTVTPDYTAGTPTATEQYIGAAVYVVTGSSKGEVHNVDAIRYGRCSSIFEFGETANYATISGFATKNDYNDATNGYNRWGLISETSGGYLWKGRMSLGTSTNAVDMRDSNKNIFIQWTPKVTANFNLIEVINSSSNIEWTNFTVTCLDTTTASNGRFLMTDPASLAFASCNFIDMDTFVFNKSTNPVTIDDTVFRRCGQITTGGASFDGCLFSNGSDATAVLTSSPANAAIITNSTFISTGTGNGLEIGGTAANITLTGLEFYNYSESVDANKAIYVNISSGSMTITASGCVGVVQAGVRSAGCTVTVNSDVTVTFTGLKDNSEVRVYKVSDGSEVAGIENATTGSPDNRSFSWSAPATLEVNYVIHNFSTSAIDYETIRVNGYTVPSNDTSIAIQQRVDRNSE